MVLDRTDQEQRRVEGEKELDRLEICEEGGKEVG